MNYAEIEIGLHHWDTESFEVDFRFTLPKSEADVRPTVSHAVTISLTDLDAVADDDKKYEEILTDQLFADTAIANAFREARATAAATANPIRFRLRISPSAAELHAVRWEMLRDPDKERLLFTSDTILFSRYVNSAVPMPSRQRPEGKMKALAVIAGPKDLGNVITGGDPLADIDVDEERRLAEERLANFDVTWIAKRGEATFANVSGSLRAGSFDLLYLVSHGLVVRGQPSLLLENADGSTDRVASEDLCNELHDLRDLPRLVVLASCKSGGAGRANPGQVAFRLGPKLAEAGVPAVVAMQGNVTIETASQFLTEFFRRLTEHGEIDRAMAAARSAIRERPDYWMPVLYMRLRAGMMWIEPELMPGSRSFPKWKALIGNLQNERCTPIIGFGAYEKLFGSSQSLARRWADTYRYPFRIEYGDDLPQVAQFLAVNNDRQYPRYELLNHFRREIHRRYGNKVPQEDRNESLDSLITRVWSAVAAPDDPHRILARLPCPVYITTHVSQVMEKALTDEKRQPYSVLSRWIDTLPEDEVPAKPRVQTPIVYHLLGRLDEIDSMVTTEDDYFDYLIGTTKNRELIPASVRRSLTGSALLFLGFRVTDWSFRVLFRSIMAGEGRELSKDFAHVAVQIDPDQSGVQEPELASAFLEQYFKKSEITIFRGTVDEFTAMLAEEWQHELARVGD